MADLPSGLSRVHQESKLTPFFLRSVRDKGIFITTTGAHIMIRIKAIFPDRDEVMLEYGISDEYTGEWLVTWGTVILGVGNSVTFASDGIVLDWEKLVIFS